MPADKRLMGLFQDPDQVVDTLKAFKASPWSVLRVHGPIPNHKIAEALDLPKSKVGYFTLAGGIIGFFFGFFFAAYNSIQWDLIVSGKPIVALVPFFIVGFEFTILFSVFGNVIGLINVGGLPDFEGLAEYDPRCSGDRYGITVACAPEREEDLRRFFQERGAQVSDLNALPQAA
jgi:molybdopterin-containing oxidoreductase family membrane subunit